VMSSGRLKIILLLDEEPMTQVGEARQLIKEFPELKEVPIPAHLGLKSLSYNTRSARAIIAPPGLPKEIKDSLENALEKVVNNPEVIETGFKTDRPLGKGQKGDDYAEQMKKDKQALMKIKQLFIE
jgi:tripartite-type tricarboxylate transporter receptor subunit TctC